MGGASYVRRAKRNRIERRLILVGRPAQVSDTDPGKPPLAWSAGMPNAATTVFILEAWQRAPASTGGGQSRSINVYTNAHQVALLLDGKPYAPAQRVEHFGQATFAVVFRPGNLTAVAMDEHGKALASHSVVSLKGPAAAIAVSLDAPSAATGTGTHVVADGEDVAMVRATLLDAAGNFAFNASNNVSFKVVSGPGRIWTTHNGDPANDNPRDVAWVPAYHGLARAFVRTTVDAATPLWHRRRLVQIDADTGRGGSATVVAGGEHAAAGGDIILQASAPGLAPVLLTIPVSTSLDHLPLAVASESV